MVHKELIRITDVIINRIVLLIAVISSISYIMSLARFFEIGWQNIFIWHTILYLLLVALTFFRKKLAPAFKLMAISSILLIISFTGIIHFGFGGFAFYLVLVIAFLSILQKRKIALILSGIILLLFCMVGFGFVSGYLVPSTDLNVISTLPSHWLAHTISFLTLIVIFIFGFGDFYKELVKTIQKNVVSEKKYHELFEKANDALFSTATSAHAKHSCTAEQSL
jgi:hypothetical protein